MKIKLVLCALSMLMPISLSAQNVLLNPGFDSDLSNWANPSNLEAVWNSFDANGSTESGSALLTNTLGNGGSTGILSQCFEVSEGMVIGYSAMVYQPSGQVGEGYGHLRLRYYSDQACQAYLSSGNSSSSASDLDTWIPVSGNQTVVASSGSVRAYLAIVGTVSSEDFSVHFDDAVLTIDPAVLFEDGFEDGTSDAWSDTVP